LISSHILSELKDFVDSVIILEKGNIVLSGGVDEIRKDSGSAYKLIIRFSKEGDYKLFEALLKSEGIAEEHVNQDKSKYIVHFHETESRASDFLGKLISAGVVLTDCSIKNDDIEDIFLKVGAKEVS